MRLSEALAIIREAVPTTREPFRLALACGFTPLHLQTFVQARLQRSLQRSVDIRTGLYGNMPGTLRKLREVRPDAAAVIVEWSELDARLGLRALGGWELRNYDDLLQGSRANIAAIEKEIRILADGGTRVAVCLPTLPLPPLDRTSPTWRAGLELQLREQIYSFAARLAENPGIEIVSPGWLDRTSVPGERLDARSELLTGFPYTVAHADAVSDGLAALIHPPVVKKGLITDLDNTLWKGIVGEVGIQGISWDLDGKSHGHALYQRLLRSLAESGVLIAIASKNEASLVQQAFQRPDIGLAASHVFPFEVHWKPKSGSVTRILETWNIAADSVVFVDDNPAELAEVEAVHPGLTCLQFSPEPASVCELIARLRNLFARGEVSEEDTIRLASLRNTAQARKAMEESGASADAFHLSAQSELQISFSKDPFDARVLELVNKTNQFNLNGLRYTESDLRAFLSHPDAFVLKASYEDKFGPLGKIAVLLGRVHRSGVEVYTWVMSCRAFSRRIEHECVHQLFGRFEASEIRFHYTETERNSPLQEFLREISGRSPEAGLVLAKQVYYDRCPQLCHRVREELHA